MSMAWSSCLRLQSTSAVPASEPSGRCLNIGLRGMGRKSVSPTGSSPPASAARLSDDRAHRRPISEAKPKLAKGALRERVAGRLVAGLNRLAFDDHRGTRHDLRHRIRQAERRGHRLLERTLQVGSATRLPCAPTVAFHALLLEALKPLPVASLRVLNAAREVARMPRSECDCLCHGHLPLRLELHSVWREAA